MRIRNLARPKLYRSKQGMISIMTTMIMIIVISLIVVGFAQISRRNQREGFDRQLSTQAFYAAESGINDAKDLIQSAVQAGTVAPSKTSCSDTAGGFYTPLVSTIDSSTNVGYSCLLVDTAPTELTFTDVGTDSLVIPLLPAGGVLANTINLTMTSQASGNPLSGCPSSVNGTLSAYSSWSCGYGIMRIDVLRTDGTFNASDLKARTMTVFAVPFASGGTSTIPYLQSNLNINPKVGMSCNATSCSLSIASLSSNSYYLRVSSLYRDMGLKVQVKNLLGQPLGLQNVQATIDATGKAQDVLRRIKVSVPLRNTNQSQLPDYAIQSTDSLCKRFAVMGGYYSNQVTGVSGTDRLCSP